jgi:hypothetical protein
MAGEPYNVGLSDARPLQLELCARIQAYRASSASKRRWARTPTSGLHRLEAKIRATGFRPHSLDAGIQGS